eukprot:Awhi_evm1s1477
MSITKTLLLACIASYAQAIALPSSEKFSEVVNNLLSTFRSNRHHLEDEQFKPTALIKEIYYINYSEGESPTVNEFKTQVDLSYVEDIKDVPQEIGDNECFYSLSNLVCFIEQPCTSMPEFEEEVDVSCVYDLSIFFHEKGKSFEHKLDIENFSIIETVDEENEGEDGLPYESEKVEVLIAADEDEIDDIIFDFNLSEDECDIDEDDIDGVVVTIPQEQNKKKKEAESGVLVL